MTFTVKIAHPAFVAENWSVIGPILAPAISLSGGRYSVDDVKGALLRGRYNCLVVLDDDNQVVAALTAGIANYPQCKAIEVQYLGGQRGMEWGRQLLEAVEHLARVAKCSRIEFRGRKEWGNVLRHDGYEAVSVLYEKVISPCATTSFGTTSQTHSPDPSVETAPLP